VPLNRIVPAHQSPYPYCFVAIFTAPQSLVKILLLLVCLGIVVAIAVAASRGKLHMAGYMGIAFLAFFAATIAGKLSGAHAITGTAFGLILSLLFFVGIATVLGCIAALIFYRPPRDPV
jgi:hypothetical protein